MRHTILLAFAMVALAGCSPTASVLGEPQDVDAILPVLPAGFSGESTMLACVMRSTEECTRIGVASDGTRIERIRDESGWVTVVVSECRDGHCYAKDERGIEWKLEP